MQYQKQVSKNLSKHPQKLTLLYQRRSALKKLAKTDLASCEEYIETSAEIDPSLPTKIRSKKISENGFSFL